MTPDTQTNTYLEDSVMGLGDVPAPGEGLSKDSEHGLSDAFELDQEQDHGKPTDK